MPDNLHPRNLDSDFRQRIENAHQAVISSLTPDEKQMFDELTPQHQRYIVSLLTRTNGCFPDDEPRSHVIKADTDDCIEHIKETLAWFKHDPVGLEEWESWCLLKSRVERIISIDALSDLVLTPYEAIRSEDQLGFKEASRGAISESVSNGYISVHRYPWHFGLVRRHIQKNRKIPVFDDGDSESRGMFFAELPPKFKIHALLNIDSFSKSTDSELIEGRIHPAKLAHVWKSYLSNKQAPSSCPPIEKSTPNPHAKPPEQRQAILREIDNKGWDHLQIPRGGKEQLKKWYVENFRKSGEAFNKRWKELRKENLLESEGNTLK